MHALSPPSWQASQRRVAGRRCGPVHYVRSLRSDVLPDSPPPPPNAGKPRLQDALTLFPMSSCPRPIFPPGTLAPPAADLLAGAAVGRWTAVKVPLAAFAPTGADGGAAFRADRLTLGLCLQVRGVGVASPCCKSMHGGGGGGGSHRISSADASPVLSFCGHPAPRRPPAASSPPAPLLPAL